jgi:hypothetical protein
MAEGDFILLAPGRESADVKKFADMAEQLRNLADSITAKAQHMDLQDLENYYGAVLADAAARNQFINQFEAAQAALADPSLTNIIERIG